MNELKQQVTPFPEASLNRLIIPGTDEKCLDLLSSPIVKKLQIQYPEKWTEIFSKDLFRLIETLWTGSGWADQIDNAEIQDVKNFWAQTNEIMIGGGILSGDNGIKILQQTTSLLLNSSIEGKSLVLAPSAQNMAIDGLLYEKKTCTLALDFGHSFVKSSFINSKSKKIVLKPVEMGLDGQNLRDDEEYVKSVLSKVKNSIQNIYKQLNGEKVLQINISIAAYIKGDYFMENRAGGYCQLRLLNKNVVKLFTKICKDIFKTELPIKVYHDGNAAAKQLETKPGAIIVFGTSIGYGFKN